MDQEHAIEQLPETHAAALRLRGRGFDDEVIASALLVPAEAVPELLRIADQKLAALLAFRETSVEHRQPEIEP